MSLANLEIAALRHGESRMQSDSEEADRLIRSLLPIYSCTIVLAENIPDGGYVVLPPGWQNGLDKPVAFHAGLPRPSQRGNIGVNLRTLRRLAV